MAAPPSCCRRPIGRKACSPRNWAATWTAVRRWSWRASARATPTSSRLYGDTSWTFEGQEIFKRAVLAMSAASADVMATCGVTADDIGLVVPHQANLRIIEAVAKRAGVPMERVFVNVHRYGNMSSATVPVALVEALEEGRVAPEQPAAAAGVRRGTHLVRTPRALGRSRHAEGHDRRRPAAERPHRARDRAGLPPEQAAPA